MEHICRKLNTGASLVYSWFEAMHTRIDLVMWSASSNDAHIRETAVRIEDEVRRIESFGSRFIPDSEVARFNSASPGVPFFFSDELMKIILDCLRYNEETGGLFDVAASAMHPGMMLRDKIIPDAASSSAIRAYDWVMLDLSGFLKGYALDRAVSLALESGISDGLFSFGNSSVSAIGNHPGGTGWPVSPAVGEDQVRVLMNQSLTTSGNSSEGRRHIIDPRTGEYVEGAGTYSVVTESAVEGEVRSTAGFIEEKIKGRR